MTDRDHFAAAALTGLLDKHDAGNDLAAWWPEMACAAAYRWADAMLREREKGTAFQDNCVSGNNPEIGCLVTEPMTKDKRAEVSQQEPVAWAVVRPDGEIVDVFVMPKHGARVLPQGFCVQPLYLTPQPTLTDAEREAIEFALDRLRGTLRGNEECDHAATLRGLLERLK